MNGEPSSVTSRVMEFLFVAIFHCEFAKQTLC